MIVQGEPDDLKFVAYYTSTFSFPLSLPLSLSPSLSLSLPLSPSPSLYPCSVRVVADV